MHTLNAGTLKSGHPYAEGPWSARVTIDGHVFDLVALANVIDRLTEAERAALVRPASVAEARVGQVGWVYAGGTYRRGVVTKVGRTRITIAYVRTDGAALRVTERAALAGRAGDVLLEVPPVADAGRDAEVNALTMEQTHAALFTAVEAGDTPLADRIKAHQDRLMRAEADALPSAADVTGLDAEMALVSPGATVRRGVGTAVLELGSAGTYDLAALAADATQLPHAVWNATRQPASVEAVSVGQLCWVLDRGRRSFCRAVITDAGWQGGVRAVYVTVGALTESRRSGRWPVVVRERAVPLTDVRVDAADPLEAALPAKEADRYWDLGRGANVLQRDAQGARGASVTEEPGDALASPENLGRVLGGVAGPAADTDDRTAAEEPQAWAAENATIGTPPQASGGESPLAETDRVAPCVAVGDVVRIHRGVVLHRVLKVGGARALVAPCDPTDERPAEWEALDILHRVPPVARLTTVHAAGRSSVATDAVVVAGAGWDVERLGEVRRVVTWAGGQGYAPTVRLVAAPDADWSDAQLGTGCLRVGDAIVIGGHCYQVTWDGGDGEPTLEPAPWRDR